MKKLKILNIDNYEGTNQAIKRNSSIIEVNKDDNKSEIEAIVCRLGKVLDAKFLDGFPKVKYIATITTGIDHIDLGYCEKNNIKIISLRGEEKFLKKIRSTPELTWGLVIALNRHLYEAIYHVKSGSGWRNEAFFGNELSGKKFGIIGYGRVGRQLSKYAIAFGMKVLVNDIKKIENNDKFIVATKDKICSEADIIVITANAGANAIKVLDADNIKKMKNNAYLINTARGSLIDESELLSALKNKRIRGAALDVLDDEVKVGGVIKSELIEYSQNNENLIITPHLGGSTFEAMDMTAEFIVKNLVKIYKIDEKNN